MAAVNKAHDAGQACLSFSRDGSFVAPILSMPFANADDQTLIGYCTREVLTSSLVSGKQIVAQTSNRRLLWKLKVP